MSGAVLLKPEARADVAAAARWYRDLEPELARRFLSATGAAVQAAAESPTAHPIIDSPSRARRIRLRGFPYRVLYLVEPGQIVVFAVLHDKRDHRVWHERLT